jgi:transposase
MDRRKALEAIFHVLRAGIQWKVGINVFGPASSIRRHFQVWRERGFSGTVGCRAGKL